MAGEKWNLERLQSESSYWRTCLLITAAHLDVFGWIGKCEKTSSAAARRFGGDSEGWEMLLNALCGMGLVRKRRDKYVNADFASRYLIGPGATLLQPNYDSWNSWGGLASVLTTGKRPRTQKPF